MKHCYKHLKTRRISNDIWAPDTFLSVLRAGPITFSVLSETCAVASQQIKISAWGLMKEIITSKRRIFCLLYAKSYFGRISSLGPLSRLYRHYPLLWTLGKNGRLPHYQSLSEKGHREIMLLFLLVTNQHRSSTIPSFSKAYSAIALEILSHDSPLPRPWFFTMMHSQYWERSFLVLFENAIQPNRRTKEFNRVVNTWWTCRDFKETSKGVEKDIFYRMSSNFPIPNRQQRIYACNIDGAFLTAIRTLPGIWCASLPASSSLCPNFLKILTSRSVRQTTGVNGLLKQFCLSHSIFACNQGGRL